MKKIGLLVLVVLFIVCLTGCDPMGLYDYYEEGDFVFAYSKDDIESQSLSLYGLSEEGKKKEYLIFPKEYNGQKVNGFGVELTAFYGGKFYRDDLKSSILKKYLLTLIWKTFMMIILDFLTKIRLKKGINIHLLYGMILILKF